MKTADPVIHRTAVDMQVCSRHFYIPLIDQIALQGVGKLRVMLLIVFYQFQKLWRTEHFRQQILGSLAEEIMKGIILKIINGCLQMFVETDLVGNLRLAVIVSKILKIMSVHADAGFQVSKV